MRLTLGAVTAVGLLFPASAMAEVVVGVAAPMSGAFASIGAEISAGVAAAAERINAAGGIGGEEIRVEVVDDKCDAVTGEAVANQLVGKGAVVVIGHACTAAALPAAKVYAANGIVFLAPAATNPRLTDEAVGNGVFRLAARSDRQAAAIAAALAPSARVAFIHDGGVYGQGLVDQVRATFEAAGGEPVLYDALTPGEESQNSIVGKLQDAAAGVVVIGALQADAAVLVRDTRERGLTATVIGGEALGLAEFRDLAGTAAEGVRFAVPAEPATLPSAAEALPAIRARSVLPTTAAVLSYAALQIYAVAADTAGGTGFDAVVPAIRAGTSATILGPVSFDEKGDRREAGWQLKVWKEGTPVSDGSGG